jgi:IPT/TIG domain
LKQTATFPYSAYGGTDKVTYTLTFDLIPSVTPLAGAWIAPTAAVAGDPGFNLTVTGSGFDSGAVVQWNGTALHTTVVSATQLTSAVPDTLLASAGSAIVSVIAGSTSIATALFTVNPPGQSCTFTFRHLVPRSTPPAVLAVGRIF